MYRVEVQVDRVTGKFASRDEIGEELQSSLESADPGSLSPGENEYEVSSWDVSEEAK